MKQNRTAGFVIITVIYVIAAGLGMIIFRSLPDAPIFLKVLAADIGATVFVYLAGVVLKNASVYDPYWSVAPMVIFIGLAADTGNWEPGVLLFLLAVCYWGVRLTLNWAYTFKNLHTQDWRYDGFKRKFPKLFQLISFLGINMFPTIVVYLCLLPGVVFIQKSAFNAITVAGFLVCIFAATLQLFADAQMHRFRHKNIEKRRIIRDGLWKHARHPNYLGEILMWWGVYLIMLSSAPHRWLLGAGALVNTLMFLFVSIPLADKHNRTERVGFDEYVRETNSLLPLKIKFIKDQEAQEESMLV